MPISNVDFRGLITVDQSNIIMTYNAVVGTVMSLLGVVSNIINIRAFIIMGLSDGMTVCFLALSIFDLSYLCFSFSLGISVSFGMIEQRSSTRFSIDPYAVGIYFANLMIILNVTNGLTTTFLAVARCMCVAKPLQFKNTFNRKITTYFLVAFTVFALAVYMPILCNMAIVLQFIKQDNMTRLTLWISPSRKSIKVIIWVLLDMVLPITTQVIVLVCILIIANSLRTSSKFRKSFMLTTKSDQKDDSKNVPGKKKKIYSYEASSNTSNKMTDKDIRVVQQVVLISLVYAICNVPKIMTSVVGAIVPEFAPGYRYNNIYLNMNTMRKHFEAFNAAINTVIYYRYNTKFRAVMWL